MKPETKTFDPTKPYRTRDGMKASIKHTFSNGRFLAIVGDDTNDDYGIFCSDGRYYTHKDDCLDLVNIPEKKMIEFWVLIKADGSRFYCENEVIKNDQLRVQRYSACLHFTREYEEGEGL